VQDIPKKRKKIIFYKYKNHEHYYCVQKNDLLKLKLERRKYKMLSKNIERLINEQINKEIFSAYLYLEMANHYGEQGLQGFKKWFDKQAKEELEHAEKFNNYLVDEGAHVVLKPIAAPEKVYANNKEPLDYQLAHEQFVTASINTIYEAALKENDHRTVLFLNWFITEQQEEEETAADLIHKYELLGGDKKGLYMLDLELGKARE